MWWRGSGGRAGGQTREGERDGARGPASRRGGKNVCVKEYKGEIKGGGHTDKKGAVGDSA